MSGGIFFFYFYWIVNCKSYFKLIWKGNINTWKLKFKCTSFAKYDKVMWMEIHFMAIARYWITFHWEFREPFQTLLQPLVSLSYWQKLLFDQNHPNLKPLKFRTVLRARPADIFADGPFFLGVYLSVLRQVFADGSVFVPVLLPQYGYVCPCCVTFVLMFWFYHPRIKRP